MKAAFKRAVAGLVVLAIIAAAVFVVSFMMCPYGSKSQVSWTELRKQENLDTVCLGSSLAGRSFDPAVMDERCKVNSFNMSTPSQEVSESVLGLKEVLQTNDIERVFYGVDFTLFLNGPDMHPGRAYLNEKWAGDPFYQPFLDLSYTLPDASWLFDKRSLNWLFPWTEQHIDYSVNALRKNVAMKLDGTSPVEAAKVNEPGWEYQGKGYGNYYQVFDYNGDYIRTFADECGDRAIDEDQIRYLTDLCDLCAQEGIELIAFVPPLTDFSIISMKGTYARYTDQIAEIVRSRGGSYYDFNLAKPELFDSRESYYFDHQHCNIEGGRAFSVSLADLVMRKDAGEDVDALFLTYDERLAGIDEISAAELVHSVDDGGISLRAYCFAGSQVKPEYQFLVRAEGGDFEVVQDYSASDTCAFAPSASGTYTVQVRVRQQGASEPFEKHTQHAVDFYAGEAA